jgi:NhaP-type Na+/H+ or K+/H+ antiporter
VLAYAAAREPALALLISLVGAIGAVMLTFVLVRRMQELLPSALIALGIAYTVSLVAHGSDVDGGAPLVAAGLLICAELAAWSLDERHAIAAERSVTLARATALASLVAVSLGVSALVVALSLAPAAGLVWTILGAVASVLVVGLAVRLARRRG